MRGMFLGHRAGPYQPRVRAFRVRLEPAAGRRRGGWGHVVELAGPDPAQLDAAPQQRTDHDGDTPGSAGPASRARAARSARRTAPGLDEEHRQRGGQREGVVDPAGPGDDDAGDDRRTPSRSARRPARRPRAQPASSPVSGAATTVDRRGDQRAHAEEGQVPRGVGCAAGVADRVRSTGGGQRRRGAARAGDGRSGDGRSGGRPGCARRCAASSAARASRAARRARGLSTTTTPTTQQHADGDQQLARPPVIDSADRAEGQQRRPEVHDQHGAAVASARSPAAGGAGAACPARTATGPCGCGGPRPAPGRRTGREHRERQQQRQQRAAAGWPRSRTSAESTCPVSR